MKKETISLDGIKEDLFGIASAYQEKVRKSCSCFVGPFALTAILFAILSRYIPRLGLPCMGACLVAVLVCAVIFIPKLLRWRRVKQAVRRVRGRGELLITVERLEHIRTETVYEPRRDRWSYAIREACFYYFSSGKRWRRICPMHCTVWRRLPVPYYRWSRELPLSPMGLDNISLEGDEFLYVCLRDEPRVSCIYPVKYFELDGSV